MPRTTETHRVVLPKRVMDKQHQITIPGWLYRWGQANDPTGNKRPQSWLRSLLWQKAMEVSVSLGVSPPSPESGSEATPSTEDWSVPVVEPMTETGTERTAEKTTEVTVADTHPTVIQPMNQGVYRDITSFYPDRLVRNSRYSPGGVECWSAKAQRVQTWYDVEETQPVLLILCDDHYANERHKVWLSECRLEWFEDGLNGDDYWLIFPPKVAGASPQTR